MPSGDAKQVTFQTTVVARGNNTGVVIAPNSSRRSGPGSDRRSWWT